MAVLNLDCLFLTLVILGYVQLWAFGLWELYHGEVYGLLAVCLAAFSLLVLPCKFIHGQEHGLVAV